MPAGWAAALKGDCLADKIADGAADRRKGPAAFGTILCVCGDFRVASFAEKPGIFGTALA